MAASPKALASIHASARDPVHPSAGHQAPIQGEVAPGIGGPGTVSAAPWVAAKIAAERATANDI